MFCGGSRRRRSSVGRRKKRRWREAASAEAAAGPAPAPAPQVESLSYDEFLELLASRERVLSTSAWIARAKEDPGRWIQAPEKRWPLAKCKSGQEEPKTEYGEAAMCSISKAVFLPFHLIFSRLPVRQLFQMRCVCKLWNALLQGAEGEVQPDASREQEEYWFVMSQPVPFGERVWNFRGFSSLDRTVFHLPLPSPHHDKLSTLVGGVHNSLLPAIEHGSYVSRCRPRLAGAGGLMCAFVHKRDALDDYFVIVFNCLTGSVRVLPPLLDSQYLSFVPRAFDSAGCQMYLSVDGQDPGRYYIMLTQLNAVVRRDDNPYFEIFDSRRGFWRVGCSFQSAVADSKVPLGDFFFLARDGNLLAYRAAYDLWSKVSVPRAFEAPFAAVFPPTFSKYKGRLLQGNPWVTEKDFCLGFVVCELQLVSSDVGTWVEIARTPPHLLVELSVEDWWPTIRAEGSLFYMTFEDMGLWGLFRPPLVYDIAQNLWYVLQDLTDFGCIFVHRPRLSLCMPHLEGEVEEHAQL